MLDRFKDTTFTCYHSLVSGVIIECRLGYQQPTITGGHEEGREQGGKEGGKAGDEREAQKRREWRRNSLRVFGRKRSGSTASVADLRPAGAGDIPDLPTSSRYRAGQADTDQEITTENRGPSLSGLFGQPGFHGDNMGAVVGTLTMQAKQRRPSRGTSAVVQWRGEQQGQAAAGREQTSLEIWKKCSCEAVHDACREYYYCSLPVPGVTERIIYCCPQLHNHMTSEG